jgi:hypothetical protein
LELEGGEAKNCLSPDDRRGEFFSRPRKFQKIVGFEYSLDFFGPFFIKEKRTVAIKNQAFSGKKRLFYHIRRAKISFTTGALYQA